jgi:Mce-associated membrane protein
MTFPRTGWRVATISLVVAIAAAIALGLWQFHQKSRIPPPVDAQKDARQELIEAVSTNMEKYLTIRLDTLDQDVATAASVLTGPFADQFKKDSAGYIAMYKELKVSAVAAVQQAGVVSLEGDTGVTVVFVNVTSSSVGEPELPAIKTAAEVGLRKINGAWLIDRVDKK